MAQKTDEMLRMLTSSKTCDFICVSVVILVAFNNHAFSNHSPWAANEFDVNLMWPVCTRPFFDDLLQPGATISVSRTAMELYSSTANKNSFRFPTRTVQAMNSSDNTARRFAVEATLMYSRMSVRWISYLLSLGGRILFTAETIRSEIPCL